jgi:hypothetical protein
MSAKDILVEAKNKLNIEGWCQHHLEFQGSHCAIGALRSAVGLSNESPTVTAGFTYVNTYGLSARKEREFLEALHALYRNIGVAKNIPLSGYKMSGYRNEQVGQIVTYNDTKGRSKEEIIDWFERASIDAGENDS